MKKNYFPKNATKTSTPLVLNCEKKSLKNTLTGLFLFLFTFLGFSDAFGQTTETITTTGAGTWIVPCGVTSITVEAWGAGGAGGGGTSNNDSGDGGGSGAYTSGIFAVTAGSNIAYTIGVGGVGSTNNGTGGGDTTILGMIAGGGQGGDSNGGTVTGIGGTASGGTINTNGNNGTAGGTGTGGNGGNAPNGGNGGNGISNGNGQDGSNPGGGGGGGERANTGLSRNRAGGNGGNGQITITYNVSLPAAPANPTSNSPQCNPPGVTLTRVGAPPAGVTWYWQTVAGGTSTANSNATFLATASGTYYLRAQDNVSGCWSASEGSLAVTVLTVPVITTNPVNFNATAGGNASFSVVANNSPTSYTWEVSTDGGTNWTTVTNGGIYSGATTATLTITGATLAMDGYIYRASATNACGTSAFSTTATLTVSNIVLVSGSGVNNVACGNSALLRDHANLANYGNNRNDYSVLNANSTAVITINGNYDVEANWDFIRIYDGAGTAGALLAEYTGAGTINYTGNPGQTLTVRFQSDFTGVRPGFELNVTYSGNCNIPCVAPTALPTALSLTATGTVISGSFTHAAPQPDNYLVVISTNPVAPSPANGTSYAVGATVSAGYTVIANGSGNSFSATGLANSTTYYIYVFSFNRLCIGGPLYLGNLNGNITTTGSDPYCIPSSTTSTRYIENVSTVGYITDISNFGTGRAATGYADFTAVPPVTQVPGGGVTLDYYLQISRQFVKVWVDWNNDGTFTDAAPELVYTTGGIQTIAGAAGFVVPLATLPGNYRIRIRSFEASQTFGPCGNLATGETEDYTLVVVADCPAKVTTAIDGERCDVGSVVLGVQGTAGVTEYRFYDAQYGGTLVGTQAAVAGTTNWNTPAITTTTTYYVTAFNGVCESWYREPIIATINPVTNITVTPSVPEVCGENNVVAITAGGDFVIDYLVNEDFEGGGFGVLNRVNPDANADTQWTNRTSPYVPEGFVWKPAITSKSIGNRFVCANSDFPLNPKDTQLRTAVLDASAYSDLFLSFRHYFSYYPGEPSQFADVDISIDGGATWPTTIASYTSNQAFAGQFDQVVIDLSAYAGQPSLMIRFRFHLAGGSAWADGWALDDVKIYGTRPLNTTFTWSGGSVDAFTDAACTIPYVAQSVSTVYVRPDASQLASPSWSFTATANLGNGCPISEFITITNSTKLWIGNISDDWYEAGNWEPVGVPDINTCIFIYDGTFDANINNTGNDAFGKTLTVRPSGFLQIQPDNNLTIDEAVTVDAGGTFTIESSGSLIQNLDVANTGTITMRRNATLKALDYVYWSSPVANFASSAISPATPTSLIWKWEPTVPNGAAYLGDFGNWVNGSESMTLGRGYIVRAPGGWPTTPTLFTANFVGTPNNGTITRTITRSDYTGIDYTGPTSTPVTENDDNWNLLGNPYPSAIDADAFISTNTHLYGFVDLWTHGAPPAAIADPFYQDYQLNYNPNDYLRYNHLGGTQFGFDGKIGAGQGFFVLMTDAGTMSEVATFNNSMRSKDHRNDQFFRTTATTTSSIETVERHRIWMKLIAPSGLSSDMLVGYATGATNSLDATFDAMNKGVKVNFELYSLNEGEGLSIQGRALPFDSTDTIPLGVAISQNGIQTIAVTTADGLFESPTQGIYLEDLVLNVIHDLRAAPYTFTAAPGRYENRFVLRYTNETLGNNDFINDNSVMVISNTNLSVVSIQESIQSVLVFDVLGRLLVNKQNTNSLEVPLHEVQKNNAPLVVQITLTNGTKINKKVVY